MILNETMNEIADAIREKTGKSEKIAPIDFATEIKSISTGGGESGTPMEYFSIPKESEMQGLGAIALYSNIVKANIASSDEVGIIAPVGYYLADGTVEQLISNVQAIGVNLDEKIYVYGEWVFIRDIMSEFLPFITPITKEQFYTLE